MEQIKSVFNFYYNLTDETWNVLKSKLNKVDFKKNEIILNEGRVCKHLYIVDKGSIRSFYSHKDKNYTNWIYFEKEMFTSWSSFINNKPSIETLQATTNTTVFKLGIDSFNHLKKAYPDFSNLFLNYYESSLAFYDLLAKKYLVFSAKEKYNFLMEHYPQLFNKASNKDIASIIGVSRETLSRMKSTV